MDTSRKSPDSEQAVPRSGQNVITEGRAAFDLDGQRWEATVEWNHLYSPATVERVTVEAPPGVSISPRLFRRVPLGQVLDSALRDVLEGLGSTSGAEQDTGGDDGGRPVSRAEVDAARTDLSRLRPPSRSPRERVPDETLHVVAALYREAQRHRRRPVVHVADAIAEAHGYEHHVALDQARSWVKIARRRGFLPPGQAGSTTTPRNGRNE